MILKKLKVIRACMTEGSEGTGDNSILQAENVALKVENEKLRYRIKILLRNMK
jgi:hypothetical protein